MKKSQGITLVALVITIIVLLILAGVTISLVIGDNGLLNKAENAGEEYIKASLKEEIELAITDISAELAMKNPPKELTKQDIIDKLQDHIQEIIIIDSALTGEYKGYEYWIDDNYVVHIGDRTNSKMQIRLNNKVGTAYITATVTAKSNEGNIVGYIYIIDGVATEQLTNNSYTAGDLLPETTHTIKAIAIDEKGNRKESQTVTLKTEKRVYLYKEGNEYADLTGEWNRVAYNCGTFTKNADHMNLYSNTTTATRIWWNSFTTENKIDMVGYTKVCAELEFDNAASYPDGWYTWLYIATGSSKNVDYNGTDTLTASHIQFDSNRTNTKVTVSANTPDTEKAYVFFQFGRNAADYYNVNCKVYNVWLEK